MNTIKDISQIFPKHLFWDVDPKILDIQDDSDFIIPRALIASILPPHKTSSIVNKQHIYLKVSFQAIGRLL